ncbi:MAG: tRNA lysidine(34) synthetase TilS [Nocardioidaceae bacterium]|nr:tRNA lysidine(34) synthetase TilS [Nocardioidaceae bacterium]
MALHPAVAASRVAVRRALAGLEPGATLLVACSGGADSLALLAAAVFESRTTNLRVVGVTVDHGLQVDSADHAAAVVAQMSELGAVETASARVRVDAPGLGPEAAARRARYEVIETMLEHFDAEICLLGHTQDDQAETVLMGLARGSGARSLAGMRRSFDHFRRPFLDLTRQQTEAACEAQGITWWTDPHNDDPAYTRVRVRKSLMPALERELGPGVAAALARTADQLRSDADFLDDMAAEALSAISSEAGLPVSELTQLAPAIRTRVLRMAAVGAGAIAAELFAEHIGEIDRLITDWRGQKGVDLPGHLTARRVAGVVVFIPKSSL